MAPALVYLHGFCSGPRGSKGEHIRHWAEARGIEFHAIDLSLPDPEHLTITAQVEAVETLLRSLPEPAVVVGTSLGGLVAAAVAHRGMAMAHLILLAPAFGFARRRMAGRRWAGYRRRGSIPVFHHALGAWITLGPELLADLPHWRDDDQWVVNSPLDILHGTLDEAVPLAEAKAFADRHPGAGLHVLEDDHGMLTEPSLAALDEVMRLSFGKRF